MPSRPPRRCPGCNQPVQAHTPCPTCRQANDRQRPSAASRGYDHKWRMTRARYLRAHPDCTHPGCNKPATDVDHITARRDGGTDQWDNLRGLCHPHHSQRTATDQPGGWNSR